MTKPRYIDRWQVDGSMQPFTADGAHMYGLFFTGGHDELARLCERYLNLDGSGRLRFAPCLDTVLLTFTRISWLTATNPPFADCGGNVEQEVTTWVLVRETNSGRLYLFTPYMLLDNPLAVQHGREIYGLPKEMAQFPQWGEDGFQVYAYSFPQAAPTVRGDYRCVLAVERAATGPPAAPLWHTLGAARDALVDAGVLAASVVPDGLLVPQGSLIVPKQYPATEDSRAACYQALIAASVRVDVAHIHWVTVGAPHKYTLRLYDFWSHPFERDLGLRDGSESLLNYSLDFDFQLGCGTELWRASP